MWRMWKETKLAVPSGLGGSVIIQNSFDKLCCSSSKNSTQRQLSAGLGLLDQLEDGMHGDGGVRNTAEEF